MIPASYLYKQAYRQHWGDDFVRLARNAANRHPDGDQPPPQRSLLRAIRSTMVRALVRTRQTKGAARPVETVSETRCPALPA